jgi:hypothetical protein
MRNDAKDPERDLRSRFEALRLSDAAHSGRFEAAWSAARRRLEIRRSAAPRRRIFLAATTATAIAAAAILIQSYRAPRPSIEEAIAQARELQSWSAPTDSLLDATEVSNPQTLPGSETAKSPGESPGASSPRSP